MHADRHPRTHSRLSWRELEQRTASAFRQGDAEGSAEGWQQEVAKGARAQLAGGPARNGGARGKDCGGAQDARGRGQPVAVAKALRDVPHRARAAPGQPRQGAACPLRARARNPLCLSVLSYSAALVPATHAASPAQLLFFPLGEDSVPLTAGQMLRQVASTSLPPHPVLHACHVTGTYRSHRCGAC